LRIASRDGSKLEAGRVMTRIAAVLFTGVAGCADRIDRPGRDAGAGTERF